MARQSERVTHPTGGERRTKQSQRTDVAKVISALSGKFTERAQEPHYGDFSSGLDFHRALNRIHEAQDEFLALPSAVRAHCQNDPGQFLDLVEDPDRRDELVELGLLPTDVPQESPLAPEVPEGGKEAPAEPQTPPAGEK